MSTVTTTGTPVGIELGYAEITTTSATFTTGSDIAGLSITVTVADRPIMVEFYTGAVIAATADKYVLVSIKEGSTVLQSGVATPGVVGSFQPIIASVRLTPTPGSHTYKINGSTQSGNGSITAAATSPSYIRAYQV